MNTTLLVKITSRAWALPILAAFGTGVPGRQAALLTATGAGRGAFGQSLDHLIALGLVERNPGHGHPLRPEFRLTQQGAAVAGVAQSVLALTPPPEHALLRRSWTLPVLGAMAQNSAFSQIRQSLPITDRALSQSLTLLETHRWIKRHITEGRPPRPLYRPCGVGAALAKVIQGSQSPSPPA